jgi:uncharacterized repeat protein (TIGR03803 family)
MAFKTLVTFNGANGATPTGALTFSDLLFWGTTLAGGASASGTVYVLELNGTLKVLHSLNGTTDGANPSCGVILKTGIIFGTADTAGTGGKGTVFDFKPGGVFNVLHAFSGPDGAAPQGLVFAASGDLYGVTDEGGTHNFGTIFKITPAGAFTSLYSFSGPDGKFPNAGLAFDTAGNLWGTTNEGGAAGCGVIFQFTPALVLNVVASFPGPPGGAYPAAGVFLDSIGNVYGTTNQGGPRSSISYDGLGSVYELPVGGLLSTLYDFSAADGYFPVALPVFDNAGVLFVAGDEGGPGSSASGTILKLPTSSSPLAVLHTFRGPDGSGPGPLFVRQTGPAPLNIALYGTTVAGGASGLGTFFELT